MVFYLLFSLLTEAFVVHFAGLEAFNILGYFPILVFTHGSFETPQSRRKSKHQAHSTVQSSLYKGPWKVSRGFCFPGSFYCGRICQMSATTHGRPITFK